MKGQGKRFVRGLAREGRWIVPAGSVVLAQPKIHGLHLPTMPKAPSKTPPTYEAALEELDQLIGQIETGQLPLEQLLGGYERGAELLAFCRGKLEAVENQIKVLDEGALKPWSPQ